jgi:hypothetical protein
VVAFSVPVPFMLHKLSCIALLVFWSLVAVFFQDSQWWIGTRWPSGWWLYVAILLSMLFVVVMPVMSAYGAYLALREEFAGKVLLAIPALLLSIFLLGRIHQDLSRPATWPSVAILVLLLTIHLLVIFGHPGVHRTGKKH